MEDLKLKAIRGGFARLAGQGASFFVRIGSLMILGRLLDPSDFGLVSMVTAITGVLALIRDFGLSSATVQRAHVSQEHLSTLFWLNVLIGVLLGAATVAAAPAVAAFYEDERLLRLTAFLATGFVINAVGVQHSAILQRQMRFSALSIINVLSLVIGTVTTVCGALAGYGYWALATMSLVSSLVATIGFWTAAGWIPGRPRIGREVLSMMRFGGSLTLMNVLVYLGYNAEKAMIGRFWGAEAIGIYGRAYQIVNMPTENLNSAIGEVAFAALSRLQGDSVRLKNYFLNGFSLILGITLPITIACALFADDLVFVLLGPKWSAAAAVVQLLAPTIVIFAIINPLGWFLFATGVAKRGLQVAPVLAFLMIFSCALGLPFGPRGVATAYSAALSLWVIPHIIWCLKGTILSLRDVLVSANRPLWASLLAGGVALCIQKISLNSLPPLPRLLLECGILFGTFAVVILYGAGQRSLYLSLYRLALPEVQRK